MQFNHFNSFGRKIPVAFRQFSSANPYLCRQNKVKIHDA